MMLRRLPSYLLIVAWAAFVGCTKKTTENGVTTLTFQSWVGPAFIFGGMLLAIFGFLVRKKRVLVGYAIMFVAMISTLATGPGMVADRLTTDDNKFVLQTGLWFSQTVYEFDYKSVNSVTITQKTSVGRHGSNTRYFANVTTNSNKLVTIPFQDTLMSYGGWEILMNNFTLHGISVVDQTGR